MQSLGRAFHGAVVHSLSPSELEYLPEALLVVSPHGAIDFFEKNIKADDVPRFLQENDLQVNVISLDRGEYLMPGFVDAHTRAFPARPPFAVV